MLESNVVFQDPGEINTLAQKIAKSIGRKIDVSSPLLDARLTDGSRINATLSPPSLDGSTITVRKFKKDPFTIVDLIRVNTLPSEVAAFLWLMADGYGTWKKNILIAGGTGCGKTTTLNALTIFIRERERVITIEDTAELQLPIQHLIRFETRSPDVEGKGEVDMDALVKNTLRMRPDRIIVGEVRSGEARSLFTAMNTGHDGSMGTVHANSSRETISRLTNPPMDVPLMMLSSLDLILMEARISLGDKGLIRRITEVTEIGGLSEDTLALSKIYEWDPAKDELQSTGTPSKLKQDLAKELGIPAKEVNNELEKRRLVLDYLLKQNIREFSEVRSWIESYYTDSDKTLSKIEESFRT
jgi:flagellar protein FlaI